MEYVGNFGKAMAVPAVPLPTALFLVKCASDQIEMK